MMKELDQSDYIITTTNSCSLCKLACMVFFAEVINQKHEGFYKIKSVIQNIVKNIYIYIGRYFGSSTEFSQFGKVIHTFLLELVILSSLPVLIQFLPLSSLLMFSRGCIKYLVLLRTLYQFIDLLRSEELSLGHHKVP